MILFYLIWVESEPPMLVTKKSKMKFIWLESGFVPAAWILQDDAGSTRHTTP
jgi:hypothetical protein